MGTYRPIYKTFWDDPDIQELDRDGKLIFLYLCTNRAVTESGIYQITPRTISQDTDIDKDKVEDILNNGRLKNIKYDKVNKVVFVRHLHKKYGTGGKPRLIIRSIINDFRHTLNSPLWDEFIEINPLYSTALPTVRQGLNNGSLDIDTIIDKDNNLLLLLMNPNKREGQPLSNGKKKYGDMVR
jgi:hypothetical protein